MADEVDYESDTAMAVEEEEDKPQQVKRDLQIGVIGDVGADRPRHLRSAPTLLRHCRK
ncbi:hypothetical protein PR003_g11427 [Phytophthora rubi]|uniref:Uncharacterized protein n=1 Tax=Phytophthora rubi TaxID=129364 RepID=A0A6A3MH20_9STRA|nr:hypothetical protein PR002_g10934 [Phytophthora rubi]KAE9031801.1 hypothetical protein PR001_g10909 [Phytophthora rubi]KAE9338595.1 hypothetical protein PR003_g11427 [Phytophthora rubi]